MLKIETLFSLIHQPFDCLILVHPDIKVLEDVSKQIQTQSITQLNVSKDLSAYLMTISASERIRYAQKWFIDILTSFSNGPILCSTPDLLFEPSLKIDPLAFFRQGAKIIPLIVLWPGEYTANCLSYAIPEHHHYRTWNITDSLIRQPHVIIHRINSEQGV